MQSLNKVSEAPVNDGEHNNNTGSDSNIIEAEDHQPLTLDPSWNMFEKIKELGVGSFGTVYLVKCTQNSLIKTDAENVLNST
jgi:hypothetical protein